MNTDILDILQVIFSVKENEKCKREFRSLMRSTIDIARLIKANDIEEQDSMDNIINDVSKILEYLELLY